MIHELTNERDSTTPTSLYATIYFSNYKSNTRQDDIKSEGSLPIKSEDDSDNLYTMNNPNEDAEMTDIYIYV